MTIIMKRGRYIIVLSPRCLTINFSDVVMVIEVPHLEIKSRINKNVSWMYEHNRRGGFRNEDIQGNRRSMN